MIASVVGLLNEAPRTTEVVEALDDYVKACKARDKAYDALQVAAQRLKAREEALERACTTALLSKRQTEE